MFLCDSLLCMFVFTEMSLNYLVVFWRKSWICALLKRVTTMTSITILINAADAAHILWQQQDKGNGGLEKCRFFTMLCLQVYIYSYRNTASISIYSHCWDPLLLEKCPSVLIDQKTNGTHVREHVRTVLFSHEERWCNTTQLFHAKWSYMSFTTQAAFRSNVVSKLIFRFCMQEHPNVEP